MQTKFDVKARIERFGQLRSASRSIDASFAEVGGMALDNSF
jgi:hypothetical protein